MCDMRFDQPLPLGDGLMIVRHVTQDAEQAEGFS